jgi:hypothetical protein
MGESAQNINCRIRSTPPLHRLTRGHSLILSRCAGTCAAARAPRCSRSVGLWGTRTIMQPARFTENLYARAQFVRLQLATDVAPVPPVAPDVAGRLPRVVDAPAPLARDLVSWLRDTERGFVSAPSQRARSSSRRQHAGPRHARGAAPCGRGRSVVLVLENVRSSSPFNLPLSPSPPLPPPGLPRQLRLRAGRDRQA